MSCDRDSAVDRGLSFGSTFEGGRATWPLPGRGPAMGRGGAVPRTVLSAVQRRLPGCLSGKVSMSSTVEQSLSLGKLKKNEGRGNSG